MATTSVHEPHDSFSSEIILWFRGFERMCRVVFALMIREMKIRYGRSRMGYAMALITPALQKGLMVTIMVLYERKAPLGPSAVLFYWAGLSSYHMFGFTVSKCLISLKYAKKDRILPVVRPPDMLLARGILEGSTNTVVNIIGFTLIYIFDTKMALPGAPLYVIESMVLMLMLGLGVSFIMSVFCVFFPTLMYLWRAVSVVLMLVSGTYKVADTLPPAIRDVLWWNPVSHGIELFRLGFYPTYPDIFISVPYLTTCACGSLVVGLALERVMRRRIAAHR
jgi:capsular polysaccharide transport system permease protein